MKIPLFCVLALCRDQGNTTKCQIDAAAGDCDTNNVYMETNCYKSCNLCGK